MGAIVWVWDPLDVWIPSFVGLQNAEDGIQVMERPRRKCGCRLISLLTLALQKVFELGHCYRAEPWVCQPVLCTYGVIQKWHRT